LSYRSNSAIYATAQTNLPNTFNTNQILDVFTQIPALQITQRGTGEAFRVEDESSDPTPFIISSHGRVGIGQYPDVSGGAALSIDAGGIKFNDGSIQTTAATGYITNSQTGAFYASSNPSGYITGINDLVYATGYQAISGRKQFTDGLDAGSQAGVSTLYIGSGLVGVNNEDPQAAFDVSGSVLFSERPSVNGTGVLLSGEFDTANFYTNNNPSGYITGIENLVYTTGDQFISGNKIFENLVQVGGLEVGLGTQTPTLHMEEGRVGINNENPTSALDVSGLAKFSERPFVNGTGVLLSGEFDGSLFYPRSNPSGYITGIENLVYTTGDQSISGNKIFENLLQVSGRLEVGLGNQAATFYIEEGRVGINNENPTSALDVSGLAKFSERPFVNGTGVLLSGEFDGSLFYPESNPSGFITGISNLVYTTGDQAISGLKTFSQGIYIDGNSSVSALFVSGQRVGVNNENPQASLDVSGSTMFSERPTVNGTGVLLEGEIQSNTIISGVVYSAQVNVKNGEGNTIYKGQPVYIKGADGSNIIIGLASNTGEATSSKTLGLVVQNSLANNAFGTVITEGLLQGFDASSANAGDPIWLGPTGSLIYGLANKPYAPDHLVYLGVVTRAQNNGELFVKVQNGYELDELHDVNVTGVSSGQFLFRNNNLWSGKSLSVSDVSNLQSSLDSKQVTGDYYASNNPSGFISGVSQFNYISGDLTGSLLSPSLSYIQGNAISAASPSAGQTLQWNGTAWVAGAVPNGGNGGGGLVYYFNFGNTSGIAPTGGLPINGHSPSQLGRNYSVGSGSVESTNLSQTGYNLICGFVTVSGEPGVTDIPAGLWDFNIWADVIGGNGSANQTQFQLKTYKYNSTSGTYTSLANSDDVYIYDPVTTAQYIANVTMPQATILETDRIYVEIWAKKNVSQSRQVRFYFDSLHPSHVHTTLPSVAGNGVVKVINGVMQSPASKIVNNDVSENAAIAISKVSQSTSKILGRTTAGTGAVEELNVAGNLELSAGTLTSTSTDVQIFTSSATWTKPAGAKSVNIQLFGAGGGGGGGRKNTQSGMQKGGGAGGGGGSYLNITLPASVLGNTEFITIGAGGTSGTGTAINGNGGVGGVGGNTTFNSLICPGGNGGGFGSDSGGTGGLGILRANNGGNGGSSTTGGGGLPFSATTLTQYGGAGGGGGGSISASPNVFFAGGTGGRSNVLNLIGGASGPVGVSGGAGINNASATTGLFAVGSGGGGGGAGIIVSGGNGGAGGFPAGGGGGGGATETGTTSGAGGVGGDGLAIITTYF
jgi:hypothetical protein